MTIQRDKSDFVFDTNKCLWIHISSQIKWLNHTYGLTP